MLKTFQILLALLGSNHWGTIVYVSLGISFSPFFTITKNTQIGINNASLSRLVLPLSSSWFVTRMSLIQQQVHSGIIQGKTLFVIPITDLDHTSLLFFTQTIISCFCGHFLLIESTNIVLIVYFNEFLIAAGWEELFLHLDAADCLGDTPEKSHWIFFSFTLAYPYE